MKLTAAPSAQTENSIAVVWEKPENAGAVEEYRLFLNGEEAAGVKETDYTFENLEPDTEYTVELLAVTKEGPEMKSNRLQVKTRKKPSLFDIRKYGAAGDGVTMNTQAIQRAIDACDDYGMVYVPEGIFRSGALFLKSHMTLYVEEGGKLLGSENPEDYPLMTYRYEGGQQLCHASLINAGFSGKREADITIEGKGCIDGSGSPLLKAELEAGKGRRGNLVCLQNVDGIYVKDITLRQSPFWCVHMIYCKDISMNRANIQSKYDENGNLYKGIFNGDGFDPDSCKNVYVFHSFLSSQDDCIAVKSGRNEEGRKVGIASENIRITNCRFRSGFGVAMGSEMSGGIRNVLVQDCVFEDSFSIASIKAPRGRGAFIENIFYDNCSLVNNDRSVKSTKWYKGAVYVDSFYGEDTYDARRALPVDEGTPVVRNIRFRDITVETKEGYAIYVEGLPEGPIQDISFENVRACGEKGMFAGNVQGMYMEEVNVSRWE